MSQNTENSGALSEEELQELVASSDAGARSPAGAVGTMMAVVAIVWSVYQILLASPWAPYLMPGAIINNSRLFHLSFALFLVFLAYPLTKKSPRDYIPAYDWVLAVLGALVALYGYFFYQKIVDAGGLADDTDKWIALGGLVLLFMGAWRALGPAMATLASIFLLYVFFGSADWVPEVIQWKGASLKKAMSHMWITSEGVFGIALGVSTKFVFLFVLFGALLDKAGAGNYFIKMAFGALGHLRGGPAKAAVVGSAATGLISGSSIANVVTTGTFTIPLMKRVGFSSEKAGAVEVASSVNGQIMPPVMGAAAFLMVEYTGIPYLKVITHAFLPAAISYIALVYIVHLEAVKKNMPTLKAERDISLARTIVGMFLFALVFVGLCMGASQTVDAVAYVTPAYVGIVMTLVVLVVYVLLIKLAASTPDLEPDDPNAAEVKLPVIGEIYKSGLYFLLPILVLVYLLMFKKTSPGLAAFWASALLIVMLLTQRPLKEMFRGQNQFANAFKDGLVDLMQGLIDGARNMIGIALATATAGVIVGTVTLTGIGQVMADLVEFLSGGNLVAMLVLVGILSLILGMGLPTTANYIVVSSLMASVVVELGAQNDLIVPLIAVHLFVFYFGIMADVTPPVGLASFAAAAVSGGDAIKTGFVAFFYSLRTVALPFVFIFNTSILLIFPQNGLIMENTPLEVNLTRTFVGAEMYNNPPADDLVSEAEYYAGLEDVATYSKEVTPELEAAVEYVENRDFALSIEFAILGIITFVVSTIAILMFTAGTMGWWLTKSRVYESIALVAIAFVLFRPDYVMNRIQPPFTPVAPVTLAQALGEAAPGDEVRIAVAGQDFANPYSDNGTPDDRSDDVPNIKRTTLVMIVGEEETGDERLDAFGLTIVADGEVAQLDEPFPNTAFSAKLSGFDFYGDVPVTVTAAKASAEQMPKELVFIPALILLALIGMLQLARARKEEGEMA